MDLFRSTTSSTEISTGFRITHRGGKRGRYGLKGRSFNFSRNITFEFTFSRFDTDSFFGVCTFRDSNSSGFEVKEG